MFWLLPAFKDNTVYVIFKLLLQCQPSPSIIINQAPIWNYYGINFDKIKGADNNFSETLIRRSHLEGAGHHAS